MNDPSDFEELIVQLTLTEDEAPSSSEITQSKLEFIEKFYKKNENKFKFCVLKGNTKKSLGETLSNSLGECWSFLTKTSRNPSLVDRKDLHLKFTSCSLNLIRLLSRDSEIIDAFENTSLLKQIQIIANLANAQEDVSSNDSENNALFLESFEKEMLNVYALKAASNLIYNSKFIQNFYAENGVAEAITMQLKQFNLAFYVDNCSEAIPQEENNKFSIMVFNLRILFLLTVFNKDLRQKLREQLQVVTYLIEIVDQIMKERLNVNLEESNLLMIGCVSSSNDQSDYCYLKLIDIEYIIEILKILYNLTMDIVSVKNNAAATMGDFKRNSQDEEANNQKCNILF